MKTPSGRGTRKLFVRSSDEIFEGHGRMLGYVAPTYDKAELATMTLHDRRTFNFQLVEEGWAAPFVIYPSLPQTVDYALFRAAAKHARSKRLGHNRDPRTLTGYGFRFCVKLMRGRPSSRSAAAPTSRPGSSTRRRTTSR